MTTKTKGVLKAPVVKLATLQKKKTEAERAKAFARVEAHLELLEDLNEFNWTAPTADQLITSPAGKAWWHKIAATFGMPREPENEAELLGVRQCLMFLVMVTRPTPWADQDADWLRAGRGVIAEDRPWAAEWFEAYLRGGVVEMREAAIEYCFIDEAAREFREFEAAGAQGNALEGAG